MQSETIKPLKKSWDQRSFLEAFVKGTRGKKCVEGNFYVRRREPQGEALEYTAHGEGGGTETIAVRLVDGTVFSNANRLKYHGTKMAWGRRTSNWNQTGTQMYLEELGALPIPFSVFQAANLEVANIKVIEKAPSETVEVKVNDGSFWRAGHYTEKFRTEQRHYVGAALLEAGGAHFLFDIDRNEIPHGIFNPFVVRLPKAATSIKEAYQILIPDAVNQAVAEKIPVERQGEWFFIKKFEKMPYIAPPTPKQILKATQVPHVLQFGGTLEAGYIAGENVVRFTFEDEAKEKAYRDAVAAWTQANNEITANLPRKGSLQQGNSRPNSVELVINYDGMVLVSGAISHSGREHRTITLKGWWQAVPNTAVTSWQVSGEID